MQRFVVTGGLGFIGSTFVRRLLRRHCDVLVLDLNTYAGDPRRLSDRGYTLERVDVASDRAREAVAAFEPDVIVHFAAESHVTRSEDAEDVFFSTNVQGTETMLEAARVSTTSLFLHISTDEVYGPCERAPFTEEQKHPGVGNATSAYARSKAVADDLAASYSDRLSVVVARPTNCFGPWQHPEKAVARWCVRAVQGLRLPVWGDGAQVRDWMFVRDVCSALDVLIEKGARGECYNVGPEGAGTTNLTIARAIAEAAGHDADELVYLSEYDRPQHDRRYAVDASKLRALGWRASRDVLGGLAETVEWYANNKWWWKELVSGAESLYADERERNAVK